jgi:NtrC-family two-component system response regulator AlgB
MVSEISRDVLDILVVDDEPSIRKMLGMWLESSHHRVTIASNPKEALAFAARTPFDLAFVDLRLGTLSGMDLLLDLMRESPWLRIVVITAFATIDTAVEAVKRGAMDYLPKPFSAEQVDLAVKRVVDTRRLERSIGELGGVSGTGVAELDLDSNDPAMQRTFHRAQQVAKGNANVLLQGESGTGKGVLARLIHRWSARSTKQFGVISCPSLSAELLESELFGHTQGAFTGALREKVGRVETCDGGTLFLDEIGDLPSALQPKLLRFLQDREFERVGDTQTRHADVRVISATHVDLDKAILQERFREDLLYRLNVVQLRIPPLRERKADLIPLAEHLLAYFAAQAHRPGLHFSTGAKHLLEVHPWPGNVRELRNVIERTVIFAEAETIEADDLGLQQSAKLVSPALGRMQSLEAVEEVHIRHVIANTPSLEEAARTLDIDIATLWRKRRKYNI